METGALVTSGKLNKILRPRYQRGFFIKEKHRLTAVLYNQG